MSQYHTHRKYEELAAELKADLRPNKALGQHFLRDRNIIEKLLRTIDPIAGERVLEIGPGPGALTIPLLAAGTEVLAIEKDARFQSVLSATAKSRGGKLDFLLQDALTINWQEVVPLNAKVVGNLPYNVGTQIVVNLLQQRAPASLMVFMLQKEVVERFLAPPKTPARGRISVWCELYCDAIKAFDVPRGAFNPPPQVISAVMTMRPLDTPRYDVNITALKTILDVSFNQRRKMLRASLKYLLTHEEVIAAGVDPAARPETLTTEQFCALANIMAIK